MDSDPQTHDFRQRPPLGQAPQGPLAKLIAFLLGTTFLVLAVMFSLVALVVVAVGGLALWGWLRWKTRALRQQMRAQPTADPTVIEGEFIRQADDTPRKPLQ